VLFSTFFLLFFGLFSVAPCRRSWSQQRWSSPVVVGGPCDACLQDRNDHQPPGSSYVSDTALFQPRMIVEILEGLSTHLHCFQVIEYYVYV